MRVSILLFDGFTALDVVGGYEVMAHMPHVELEFVAAQTGIVAADSRRLGMAAYRSFSEVSSTDVLYVPGGPGVVPALEDRALLDHIKMLDAGSTWTIGICNGVALLGAAGLLKDREVTTNWSWRQRVAAYGPKVSPTRYQRDGKYITAAGVSASIDAALFFSSIGAGERVANMIQLGLEYFPEPPSSMRSAEDASMEAREAVLRFERTIAVERLRNAPRPF